MRSKPENHKPLCFSLELAFRFWTHVKVGSEGCWGWIGMTHGRGGYGLIEDRGVRYLANRVAWLLKTRSDPGHLCVLHRCDNPPCVRPSHLFLGTFEDNMRDRIRKGRTVAVKGSEHFRAKLKESDIPAIRRMLANGISLRKIGERFGVHKETIRAVSVGITWSHIPHA